MIKCKRNKGFTLIELLVVIAIIGVLSSVVLASLNSARAKARDATRIAQMQQMQRAFELFYATNGTYPGDVGVWYTNSGQDYWWIREPSQTTNQSDPRLVRFYDDLAQVMPAPPIAPKLSSAVYIAAGDVCETGSAGAWMQYRKTDDNNYKLSTRLEQDCDRVKDDGGTSTCCPLFGPSLGRSYEVYEVFTPSAAANLPTY